MDFQLCFLLIVQIEWAKNPQMNAISLLLLLLTLVQSSSAFAMFPGAIVRSRYCPIHFGNIPQQPILRLPLKRDLSNTPVQITWRFPVVDRDRFFWDHEQKVGDVTQDIWDGFRRREFTDLESFQRAFWKAMSLSLYAGEFSEENYDRMLHGRPPIAPVSQQLEGRTSYELYSFDGDDAIPYVIDLSAIGIATPQYIEERQALKTGSERPSELR